MDATISSFFDDVFEDGSTDDMWLHATEARPGNFNAQELPTANHLSLSFGSPPACDAIETELASQVGSAAREVRQLSDSGPCIDLSWLEDDNDVPSGRHSSVAASPLASSPCSSAASDSDQCGQPNGGGAANEFINGRSCASASTERSDSETRANKCTLSPPLPSDEELARLSIPELEQRFKGAAFTLVSMLKRRRRMILNRRYARNSRSKRACKDQTALCEVDELRRDRDKWKALAETLMREIESYKKNKR